MTDFVIICHGRTEMILSTWLRETTGLPIHIDGKNDGHNAIMLNNLVEFMKDNGYYSVSRLKRRFPDIEYRHRAGLKDLILFIVMDVDVDRKLVNGFVTKKMFEDCPLRDNIVPILSNKSLDDVMKRIGFLLGSYDKLEEYKQVLNIISLKELYLRVNGRDDTNLDVMLSLILEHVDRYQNQSWLCQQ